MMPFILPSCSIHELSAAALTLGRGRPGCIVLWLHRVHPLSVLSYSNTVGERIWSGCTDFIIAIHELSFDSMTYQCVPFNGLVNLVQKLVGCAKIQ